jgi:hypothetical protein
MKADLPRTMVRRTRALQSLMITVLALAACQDFTAPPSIAPAASRVASETKFWEASSSVAWNTTARNLITAGPGPAASAVAQVRVLTYLSVAQYNAVVRAEDTKAGGVHASPAAASAAASLVVLKTLNVLIGTGVNFPAAGATLDAKLAAERAAAVADGKGEEFDMGAAVGRAVGAEVVAYALTDNANQAPLPVNPGGLGNWTPAASPIVRGLYGSRTFALTSGSQFRPGPPPAINSPEFQRDFAQTRAEATSGSQANLDLAVLWAGRGGAYLNGVATDLIVAHHRNEREAARILALANMAGFDATNACFDAKFAYYLIRPTQYGAQQGLAFNTLVGLPNHPSYPSGHSCQTASYATALAAAFPEREARDYLAQAVEDAGRSRMVGGLHYLFDCTVGQELGRNVADWVLRSAPVGHDEIPLVWRS